MAGGGQHVLGFPDIHYDPTCYLCPGNERAGGKKNPDYDGVFTFDNDYAALLPDSPDPETAERPELLRAERERGRCRVLCFHPDHSLTLARMKLPEIRLVVDAWAEQYDELGEIAWIKYVQIFENRGAMMGASNPHPHGQIWSTELVPDEPASGDRVAGRILGRSTARCLLCDYVTAEKAAGTRMSARTMTSWCWCHGGRCGLLRCCCWASGTWARCRSSARRAELAGCHPESD